MHAVAATIVATEKTIAEDILKIYRDMKQTSGCRLTVLDYWIYDADGARFNIQIEHRELLLPVLELRIVSSPVFQKLLREQRSGARKEFTFFLFPYDRLSGFRVEEIKNGLLIEIPPFEAQANLKAFAERLLIEQVVKYLDPNANILWEEESDY